MLPVVAKMRTEVYTLEQDPPMNRLTMVAVAKRERHCWWQTSWWQQQVGIRWAQSTINLGSGGCAVVLVGQWRRNARTEVLLG
jgi:hypothetical protein